MAAQRAFGPGQQFRLDPLTVTMGHPDGQAALAAKGEVTAHFTAAPYMYEELAQPGVHRVLDSYAVLGGPHTFNVVWATSRYHDAHPLVMAAFMAALERAMAQIREQPEAAAALWVRIEHARMDAAQAAAMVRLPDNEWTTAPRRVMQFMRFMHSTGVIGAEAGDWRALFFPEAHGLDGS